MALLERKEVGTAEQHLKRAAALEPTDPHSRFQLGRLAAASGRPAEAAALFADTVRLKPDYADAHYSLGSMLAALDRRSEAIAAFDRARAAGLAPEWEYHAHLGAGVLLARDGRITEAAKHFEAAVALQPNSAEAQRNLALAQAQLRQSTASGKPGP
jgi:tetratricopeptide (TPR) repeat protein